MDGATFAQHYVNKWADSAVIDDVELTFRLVLDTDMPLGQIVDDASVFVPLARPVTSTSSRDALYDVNALMLFMAAFQAFGMPVRSVARSRGGREIAYVASPAATAHGVRGSHDSRRSTPHRSDLAKETMAFTGDGDRVWVVAALDGWTPAELKPAHVRVLLGVPAFARNVALNDVDVPSCMTDAANSDGNDFVESMACAVTRNGVRMDAAKQYYDVHIHAIRRYKDTVAAAAQAAATKLHEQYVS
jgi:hypothetical protein